MEMITEHPLTDFKELFTEFIQLEESSMIVLMNLRKMALVKEVQV
jgi:hypothetical protein